ncbi:MAG TPA: flagellar biosynthetic protein FliO [Bryobacteraceae bacterium]|jgi:flagellar biosynthetic protein FliO
MLQQSLAVFLVLALLFAALWLLRRKGLASLPLRLARPSAGRRQMRVIERIPLSAQHSLHLVSVSGRMLVIGVSPGGCSPLASWPQASQGLGPEEALTP